MFDRIIFTIPYHTIFIAADGVRGSRRVILGAYGTVLRVKMALSFSG